MILLILCILFLVFSMIFAMFGFGGGLFYAPILVLVDFPIATAALISLASILATSLGALLIYRRAGKISWRLAAVVDPPTDIMAFIGGVYSYLINRLVAMVILIVVMIVAGYLMIKGRSSGDEFMSWRKLPLSIVIRHDDKVYEVNLPITFAATSTIGFIAGVVGITGGVFKIPIMHLLCGVPMDVAIATSTLMVLLTALFGLAGHLYAGLYMSASQGFMLAVILAFSSFIGGILGALKALRAEKTRLRRLFGILLLCLAVSIAIKEILRIMAYS